MAAGYNPLEEANFVSVLKHSIYIFNIFMSRVFLSSWYDMKKTIDIYILFLQFIQAVEQAALVHEKQCY